MPTSVKAAGWMLGSLVSLPPLATWGELAEWLERCSVSQLPVVGPGGEVLGWAGDRELRHALQAGAAE